MHQLMIDNLGPIKHCELPIEQYTVLTGYQASGKSTIAKSIYFFRTLKEDIYKLIVRQNLLSQVEQSGDKRRSITSAFESAVRNKFMDTFGSSYGMHRDMQVSYQYSEAVAITIRLETEYVSLVPNFIWVDYTQKIRNFLVENEQNSDSEQIREKLNALFDDPFETVYIPAGRSVLTVLGSQFNYLYSTMDDAQKRLVDSCTRDYLERVMKLRPHFSEGLEGVLGDSPYIPSRKKLYGKALELIKWILKGKYAAAGGEERIWVDEKHYVKINYASSGQQEVVWIANLLFYYLASMQKVFFIIEEPESNLFPESQKMIVELISLVAGAENSVLITTHSPYVLGAINNLLYAGTVGAISDETEKKTAEIIPECEWIRSQDLRAYFVRNGGAEDCVDTELMQIDNDLLDQISHVINVEYDTLFEVEQEAKGES